MATRTIDEGSMDEGSGMNFSEYVAILSGNTDLLEKAKLEKKITALESERQAFNRSKSSAIYKYEDATRSIDSNNEMISRMTKDLTAFNEKVQIDKEGNKLNPIRLDNFDSNDPKAIGEKLNQLSDNARTNGEYFKIGDLYSYNNGHIATDPLLASKNFINALEKIPNLMQKYQVDNQKLEKDIPILKEVIDSTFKKEPQLRELKSELDSLNRQINLTLANKDQQPEEVLNKETDSVEVNSSPNKMVSLGTISNERSAQPMSLKDIIDANKDHIIITSVSKPKENEDTGYIKKKVPKGIKM